MSTQDKLADALEHTARHRAATEGIDPDQWRVVLFKWEALALQAHVAEAAQAQAQDAEPVAITKDSDDLYTGWLSWTGKELPPGTKLYTHPQPAQDAKDAATIERVARAIYEHVFTMSIPRMGVRSATFEEVWAIPSERERLTAQACAAIDTAMAKESGR